MKRLSSTLYGVLYVLGTSLFLFTNLNAQTTELRKEDKLELLLNEKNKYNGSLGVANRWKIQVFNGKMDDSKNAYVKFKKDFKEVDATIVFSAPYYKVWVGNCRTRMEAEKILIQVKKIYPGAFLVKPRL